MSTADDNTAGGSEEITSSKEVCISCEQNNVNDITGHRMDILKDVSICGLCGKERNSEDMNTCNKCKMVKYCNAACKKKHRSKHKKACERHVAELHDEQLFKDHPTPEECPICMLPIYFGLRTEFRICCGKTICDGCFTLWMIQSQINAVEKGEDVKGKNEPCPFCRDSSGIADYHDNNAYSKRMKELIENDNAQACYYYGVDFSKGQYGLPQDWTKANELYLKAGELGCADAYSDLGGSFLLGYGVEVDKKKALYYIELAAMMGSVMARHNLGNIELLDGNYHRGMKHYMIGARAGYKDSLNIVKREFMDSLVTKDKYTSTLQFAIAARTEHVKSLHDAVEEGFLIEEEALERIKTEGFMKGVVTKDEYESTLRAYHEKQIEMKSEQRVTATRMRAALGCSSNEEALSVQYDPRST